MSARAKLRAVPDTDTAPAVASDDILLCRVRSVGHDWGGGTTRWEEAQTYLRMRVGGKRRSSVYVTHAVTDCPRCGTVRTEVFEQHGEWITKIGNRYRYPPVWKEVPQLTQSQLQTARWRRAMSGA